MDAFIIVSHKLSPHILIKFRQIKEVFNGDVFLVLDDRCMDSNISLSSENILLFNWNKLKKHIHAPIEPTNIVPGNNHFLTLSFFKSKPIYENYWSMEYDVDFLGNWKTFFNIASKIGGDFVSCHIQKYEDDPNWYWWNSFHSKDTNSLYYIPCHKRIRSFNPIYRISNAALRYLDKALRDGVYGHHEVVIPTLLFHHGFEIRDFGGMPEEAFEKGKSLYISRSQYSRYGSMQHIDFENLNCFLRWTNVLVHPVKT